MIDIILLILDLQPIRSNNWCEHSCANLLLVCRPFPRVPAIVDIDVLLPLLGNFLFREYCLNGAFWNTSNTVNKLLWINVELILAFKLLLIATRMNTIDRTGVHAGRVFHTETGFRDDECHLQTPAKRARYSPIFILLHIKSILIQTRLICVFRRFFRRTTRKT